MRLTLDGITQSLEAWAADYGIPCALIRQRLRQGWGTERAVTELMAVRRGERLAPDALHDDEPALPDAFVPAFPGSASGTDPAGSVPEAEPRASGPRRRDTQTYTHAGHTRTISEWAAHLGISRQAMHLRLKEKGEDAFARPQPRSR